MEQLVATRQERTSIQSRIAVRVLHLATWDQGGGGFNAAYRLHRNMRYAGVDSVMLVLAKQSDDPHVIGMAGSLDTSERLRWLWNKLLFRWHKRFRTSPYFYIETGSLFQVDRLIAALPFKPDAIVVHWVSTFLTADMMRQLSASTGAPLYWYMMDMAPMTGGCHYAFECKGYMKQCGHCPQLRYGRNEFDISNRQWQLKFSNFRTTDITAVVGSSWLMRQAMESSIFSERPIKQIMLGLDANVFKPAAQADARATLGLPGDRKIIFFGAQSIHEERKGLVYLVDALNQLYATLEDNPDLRKNILVVIAGYWGKAGTLEMRFEHRYIGALQGDTMLAAAYQAADIFVNASIEDSGPMMINESILCGTPVVSFDMGVAPDLVHTGRTGYRARLRDAADMAAGLRSLLEMDADSIQAMRTECRRLGVQLCHSDTQVQAFLDLFASHPSL
jgi:glycosyltransferase involved in cell wall biosynthesis